MKFILMFLFKSATKIGDYSLKLQKYLLLKIHNYFFTICCYLKKLDHHNTFILMPELIYFDKH
jgi:hypothetical protein